MTKNGEIKEIYPGGNDGSQHGVGQIEETINDVGQGKPYFVFQTPQGVDQESVPLQVGFKVTFDAQGQLATNVKKALQIISFTASGNTLSWETLGATSASIDNGVGDVSDRLPNGSVVVNAPGVYTLTISDGTNSVSESAEVVGE